MRLHQRRPCFACSPVNFVTATSFRCVTALSSFSFAERHSCRPKFIEDKFVERTQPSLIVCTINPRRAFREKKGYSNSTLQKEEEFISTRRDADSEIASEMLD
ncbi:hypothetical protein AVEN_234669-1 [Araneus ventricosus]|uniref:Uncharacterized protein n=1 Tax=Araneus ventricosus TaxID=182803 RepID=A0A4Y2CZH9_ARAVE|nr:hypothetical protein AVEN_234669-1 [Araneus ventricosus]